MSKDTISPMRGAVVLVTAILVAGGCAAGLSHVAPPAATPISRATQTPPAATVPSRTPARTILFNETTQADAPVIRKVSNCREIVGGWRFQDTTNDVTAWWTPDGYTSGTPPRPGPHEEAHGAWKGEVLQLEGALHTPQNKAWIDEPRRYELRATANGHLVGTRNGTPIDLAPTVIQGPDCSHEPPVP